MNTNQNNINDTVIVSQQSDNVNNENSEKSIAEKAIEKLDKEYKEFKGGNKEKAVLPYVRNRLEDFCRQDERFADTFYRFKRTLSDCLGEIMKGVGSSISDIDVYRAAIQFYFPNTEVDFNVIIKITGDAPSEEEINKLPPPPPEKKQKTKAKKTEKKAEPKKAAKAQKTAEKPKPKNEYIQLSLF